ncbi:Type 2 DNA topoisomerase 6 subunit B-like [Manis javanica]|nr:Type 2 DNA topoisomerase 6 subunit B-like [Manis javanica]
MALGNQAANEEEDCNEGMTDEIRRKRFAQCEALNRCEPPSEAAPRRGLETRGRGVAAALALGPSGSGAGGRALAPSGARRGARSGQRGGSGAGGLGAGAGGGVTRPAV